MNDDLERALRERIREGFAPAPASDHADSVRVKVTPPIASRNRPVRRQVWVTAAALAAVVVAVTIITPRLIGYDPASGTRPAQGSLDRGPRGPVPIAASETEISGIVRSASELAADGQRRTDLSDARRHLSFEPILPSGVPGTEALTGLYTASQRTGAPRGGEPDNVLAALYEGGLTVTEKRLDPQLVTGPEDFARLVGLRLARGDAGTVQAVSVQGTTVALWSPTPAPPQARSRAYWFRAGVGYMLTAPVASPERLVAVARTMLR